MTKTKNLKITKEDRDIPISETKPAGIVELNKFILKKLKPDNQPRENIEKAMRIIANPDVLREAYNKVSRSSGVSFGQNPVVDEE